MKAGIICKISDGARVVNVTEVAVAEDDDVGDVFSAFGVLPRVVRLSAFRPSPKESNAVQLRDGRILVVGISRGEKGFYHLRLSKPLNQSIPAAAPGDYVVTDCPDEWP
jgi:hypothetical protein